MRFGGGSVGEKGEKWGKGEVGGETGDLDLGEKNRGLRIDTVSV